MSWITDIFSSGGPQAAAQPAPESTTADSSTPAEEKSPLDSFADMWKNDDKGGASGEGKKSESNFFDMTPESVMESAKQSDFTKLISPEMQAKIAAGGSDAVAAMSQLINTLGQTVFAQSTYTNAQLMEAALTKQREAFMAELPNLIKSQAASNSLAEQNPIFSHPAAKPMLEALKQQLITKYPDATPAELNTQAQSYLKAFAEQLSPKQDTNKQADQGMDWSAYFNQN